MQGMGDASKRGSNVFFFLFFSSFFGGWGWGSYVFDYNDNNDSYDQLHAVKLLSHQNIAHTFQDSKKCLFFGPLAVYCKFKTLQLKIINAMRLHNIGKNVSSIFHK